VLTIDDVVAAEVRTRGHVRITPCTKSEPLSARVDAPCFLKLENLQRTGSFKERGAANRLFSLSEAERKLGVIAASAGNHAQGVAAQAAQLGIRATIVMPERTPLVKVQNTRDFGARVVLKGASYDEAYEEAVRLRELEGQVFVHPFDDDLIIAGQGTVGLEILAQVPDVEALVIAIGGGGLCAGVALAVKARKPDVKIYGVQTRAFPSMKDALAAGSPQTLPPSKTMAEGIAVRRAGARSFEIIQKYVEDIALVDEEEIAEAILFLLEREKTVAEGAGAAPVAAMLGGKLPIAGKKTVAIVCGGNIDVTLLSRIIDRGLVKSGRLMKLLVRVPDTFGSLAALTTIVGAARANIVEIHHHRAFAKGELSEVSVELTLETRGFEHVQEITQALAKAQYAYEWRTPEANKG
jgi:threonine dehydratase